MKSDKIEKLVIEIMRTGISSWHQGKTAERIKEFTAKIKELEGQVCPRCFSRELIKSGSYKGGQRWKCLICNRTTTKPRHRMPKNYQSHNLLTYYLPQSVKQDWYQDVLDFHEQVILDNFPKQPYIPDEQEKLLRNSLITEEINETLDAITKDDLVKIADGICDSIVVLLGTAVTYGIDIRPIWNEVHKTNMAKKGGKLREDGKLLKPDGWEPPNIKAILEKQKENNYVPICSKESGSI